MVHLRANRRFASPLLAAALVLTAAACGGQRGPKLPEPGSIDADKFLFDRGTQAIARKRWLEAREYFRRLVDTYPQSPYRMDAKLGLGDSYIGENTLASNILADNEFREFLSFFPLNPKADYAQFKIGLAHFRQMLSPQRDQTATREAIAEFNKFLTNFPASPLRPEAEKYLRQARDRLSESEFQIGLLYYRIRWPPGAIDRFRTLLAQDPEFTGRDRVYYYLGESLLRVQRKTEALPYFERLLTEFPSSKHQAKARARVAELKR